MYRDNAYMTNTEQGDTMTEQYYVFTGPDGWAWVEMYYEGRHVTAPSPHKAIADCMASMRDRYPMATVDELMPEDIADAMRYTF